MRPFFLRGISFVRSWGGRTVKVCVCVSCLVSGGGLVSLDLGFLQSLVRPIWSIDPSRRVEVGGIFDPYVLINGDRNPSASSNQ
jgi:hypothetical protein